jgi:hypothetical protein
LELENYLLKAKDKVKESMQKAEVMAAKQEIAQNKSIQLLRDVK